MKMIRLHVTLLAAALVAPSPAPAQKVCISANVNVQQVYRDIVPRAWFALPFVVSAPGTITAADLKLKTHPRSPRDGRGEVGIWDANGRLPGKLLTRAPITVSRGVAGWYGARFAKGVAVTPGRYFVAMRSLSAVQAGAGPRGVRTPYYWGPPAFAPWRGPISAAWSYRVYCGTHGGTVTTYGTCKTGTGGFAPRLRGLGQANTTNTLDIQVSNALGGAPGALAWGPRASTRFSLGTLFVTPAFATPVQLVGNGAGKGHFTVPLPLPNNASWKGFKLAVQGWLLDAGAAGGVSHSGGLELTIGH